MYEKVTLLDLFLISEKAFCDKTYNGLWFCKISTGLKSKSTIKYFLYEIHSCFSFFYFFFFNSAVGTTIYLSIGFAFAFGASGDVNSNFFLSYDRFLLIDATNEDYNKFGDDVQYLMLALVLCNSGFISRMRYWVYPVLTIFIAGWLTLSELFSLYSVNI